MKMFFHCVFAVLMTLSCHAHASNVPAIKISADNWGESAIIHADKVMVFNGIPKEHGWGEDLVYRATASAQDTRIMGAPPLGGIPLITIWSETEGVALFNMADSHEPFTVQLQVEESGTVTIRANGGSNIVKISYTGDYYDALREFANRMHSNYSISAQPAPDWSYDPIWETYGFEESWNKDTVLNMLPLLKELGIKTITFDSGWYGSGTSDWQAMTGDFPINPDVIGTEQDFIDFIGHLHQEGFKVRIWWAPGVAEQDTDLYTSHPDWFYSAVTPSWGDSADTGDWYLNPTLPAVRAWNRDLVKDFIAYGVDGFKQDDIYEIDSDDPDFHAQYSALFKDIYTTALSIKPDFVINTCNCGIAQNFFDFPGENQLITSDPVGSAQFRRRAKYLHGLNVNGAAILADHVELTQGDVGAEDLIETTFYDQLTDSDFASSVAMGMVLTTKLTRDPGELYSKWFKLYQKYKFYRMKWVNIPYFDWSPLETFLMRDNEDLYYTFFSKDNENFSGDISFSHLEKGSVYSVYDVVNETLLPSFIAEDVSNKYHINFTDLLMVRVRKTNDKFNTDILFDWAEAHYQNLFPSNQPSLDYDVWYYRFYASTNTYLGLKTDDSDIYVLGDEWGGLTKVGALNELINLVSTIITRQDTAYRIDIPLDGSLQNPAFSPDGKSIVFTRFRDGYNKGASDLFVYNLETEELFELISDGTGNVNLPGSVWNEELGSIIFSSAREPHDEIFLISEDETTGSKIQITSRANKQSFEPSLSPDGQWIVFESHVVDVENDGIVTKYRTDGTSGYIDLTPSGDNCKQPNWSPTGDRILYQKQDNGKWDIWVMNIDGSNKAMVTSGEGNKTDAVFSYDGGWIIYSSENDEVALANIYKIPVSGGVPICMTYYDGYDGAPSISANGRQIVFESSPDSPDISSGTTIWILDVANISN